MDADYYDLFESMKTSMLPLDQMVTRVVRELGSEEDQGMLTEAVGPEFGSHGDFDEYDTL